MQFDHDVGDVYGFTFAAQGDHSGFDLSVLGKHLAKLPLEQVERIYDMLRLYHHRLPELEKVERYALDEINWSRRAHQLPPLQEPIRITGTKWCIRDKVLKQTTG